MIDCAAYKGHLTTTVNLIHLMQMLIQGQWLDHSSFQNVPHFEAATIRKLARIGVYYLPQLVAKAGTDLKRFLEKEVGVVMEWD